MPPFSEVDKTAPCKFVCTAIELITSCRKHKEVNEHKLLAFSHINNTNHLGGTMKNQVQLRMSSLQGKLQLLQIL